MIKEHDIISLITPMEGLPAGATGTVVHVYPNGWTYEVEFDTIDGPKVITLDLKRFPAELIQREETKKPTQTHNE